jgi:pilus assembly protein CpaB
MKNGKGKAAIGVALLLGAVASYMVYGYLSRASQEAKPVPMGKVVTAVKDIPARTAISSSMVHLVDVPLSAKLPLAVSSLEQADGKISKQPIGQGQQLLPSQLFADTAQSGLAFNIPPGKRAMSISVNELLGSGGLIVPGDHVDVMVVVDTKDSSKASPQPSASAQPQLSWEQQPNLRAVAQYVLQDIQVLAVAQDLASDVANDAPPAATGPKSRQASASASAAPYAAQPTAHTATLAVTPDQAERLALAEDQGHIRLVLRSYGDDGTINMQDGLFVGGDGLVGLKSDPGPQ